MSLSMLADIETKIFLYGYLTLMILGIIGNLFVVLFFSQKRQNACTIYLLSSAIMNILYLIINGFVQLFPFDYVDGTIDAIIFCKIYSYLPSTLGQVAKTTLILACIDRFLITNEHIQFRALSTPKQAKYLILFSVLFWLVVSVHIPIMATVVNGSCTTNGAYSIVFSIYAILFVNLIPFLISCMFGYLTYRNMRRTQVRVQPIGISTTNGNSDIRRRDRDLLIIVVSEILVFVLTTLLFPVVLLEMMISQYIVPNKNIDYFQREFFALNIAFLFLFINSAALFYTYFVSSKAFRRELKQLIINNEKKYKRQIFL